MSEIIFMIKCKKCKKVEFDQGDTNIRNCPECRTTNKKEMRERYNIKRQETRVKAWNKFINQKRNEV